MGYPYIALNGLYYLEVLYRARKKI